MNERGGWRAGLERVRKRKKRDRGISSFDVIVKKKESDRGEWRRRCFKFLRVRGEGDGHIESQRQIDNRWKVGKEARESRKGKEMDGERI